jgi:MFS transporter, PPP family, 3-phenylpropionic acid transporter
LTPLRQTLAPFAALSASYFAHIGFFNPYLTLWLKDLGFSLVVISLLASSQSITRIFAPYVWGWISDHTGERVRLLRYSALGALVCSVGLWWSDSGVWLAVVLLLMFTHTSSMMPMSEAAMSRSVTVDGVLDVKRYGRVRLWGSLGFLIMVFAAGAWFERRGMADFPAWTFVTLLGVVASTWWLPDTREAVAERVPVPPLLPLLRLPAVAWFFAALFWHVLAHFSIYVFLSLYLDGLGYTKTQIGLLWAVSVVVEILWFFTQGRWMGAMSLPRWLAVCAAVMVFRMIITSGWGGTGWAMVLAQLLHALTFGAHHASCMALVSQLFPDRLRGRGQALYAVIGYGVPGVLAGLLGGVLADALGLVAVFWASVLAAALAVGCAVQLSRVSGRTDATQRPPSSA